MLSKKVFFLYSSKIMVLFALKKETINLTSRIPWCMDYPYTPGDVMYSWWNATSGWNDEDHFLWCQKYIKKDYKPRMPYSFYKE